MITIGVAANADADAVVAVGDDAVLGGSEWLEKTTSGRRSQRKR